MERECISAEAAFSVKYMSLSTLFFFFFEKKKTVVHLFHVEATYFTYHPVLSSFYRNDTKTTQT